MRNLRPKSRSSATRSGERPAAVARRRLRRATDHDDVVAERRAALAGELDVTLARGERAGEHHPAAGDCELAGAVEDEQAVGKPEEPQVLGLPLERGVAGARRDPARSETAFAAADLERLHPQRLGVERRRQPAVDETHALRRHLERQAGRVDAAGEARRAHRAVGRERGVDRAVDQRLAVEQRAERPERSDRRGHPRGERRVRRKRARGRAGRAADLERRVGAPEPSRRHRRRAARGVVDQLRVETELAQLERDPRRVARFADREIARLARERDRAVEVRRGLDRPGAAHGQRGLDVRLQAGEREERRDREVRRLALRRQAAALPAQALDREPAVADLECRRADGDARRAGLDRDRGEEPRRKAAAILQRVDRAGPSLPAPPAADRAAAEIDAVAGGRDVDDVPREAAGRLRGNAAEREPTDGG